MKLVARISFIQADNTSWTCVRSQDIDEGTTVLKAFETFLSDGLMHRYGISTDKVLLCTNISKSCHPKNRTIAYGFEFTATTLRLDKGIFSTSRIRGRIHFATLASGPVGSADTIMQIEKHFESNKSEWGVVKCTTGEAELAMLCRSLPARFSRLIDVATHELCA